MLFWERGGEGCGGVALKFGAQRLQGFRVSGVQVYIGSGSSVLQCVSAP